MIGSTRISSFLKSKVRNLKRKTRYRLSLGQGKRWINWRRRGIERGWEDSFSVRIWAETQHDYQNPSSDTFQWHVVAINFEQQGIKRKVYRRRECIKVWSSLSELACCQAANHVVEFEPQKLRGWHFSALLLLVIVLTPNTSIENALCIRHCCYALYMVSR